VNVSMPLRETDVIHSADLMRTFDLPDDAGERIGQAVAVVDTRRRLVTIRELRYDASRASEADARRALQRFLDASADESKGQIADE
jgi:hypothetical protein